MLAIIQGAICLPPSFPPSSETGLLTPSRLFVRRLLLAQVPSENGEVGEGVFARSSTHPLPLHMIRRRGKGTKGTALMWLGSCHKMKGYQVQFLAPMPLSCFSFGKKHFPNHMLCFGDSFIPSKASDIMKLDNITASSFIEMNKNLPYSSPLFILHVIQYYIPFITSPAIQYYKYILVYGLWWLSG